MDKFKEELTITELIKESPKASAYEKTLIQGRFKVGRFKNLLFHYYDLKKAFVF